MIKSSIIEMTSIGDRMFELTRDWHCEIQILNNHFNYFISAGFHFDARSGGKFFDWLVPWTGPQEILRCWLIHDVNYYGLVPFSVANDLLRIMLLEVGFNKIKTFFLYWSARLFGRSAWSAFDEYPGDKYGMNFEPIKKYKLILNGHPITITPDEFTL